MICGIAQSATATSRTCFRVGQDLTAVGLPAREDAKRISGVSAPKSTCSSPASTRPRCSAVRLDMPSTRVQVGGILPTHLITPCLESKHMWASRLCAYCATIERFTNRREPFATYNPSIELKGNLEIKA